MSNKRVLYIEDSPANMALMVEYFKELDGLELLSAITGEEGLDIALAEIPDLILMDINLPGISGIEAFVRLQGMDQTRHIPVIAISADAMPHDIQKALNAGLEHYLTKPIQLQGLEDLMRRLLA